MEDELSVAQGLQIALEEEGYDVDLARAMAETWGVEAEIVAMAGQRGRVTISTNMAGRGTDIVLGGNPETMAWAQLQDKYETRLDVPRDEWDALVAEIDAREKMSEEGEVVKKRGGLHVIGTERHEARRIDAESTLGGPFYPGLDATPRWPIAPSFASRSARTGFGASSRSCAPPGRSPDSWSKPRRSPSRPAPG